MAFAASILFHMGCILGFEALARAGTLYSNFEAAAVNHEGDRPASSVDGSAATNTVGHGT